MDLVEWRNPAAGVLGDTVLLDVLVNDGLLFSFQEILQRIVKRINFGACRPESVLNLNLLNGDT